MTWSYSKDPSTSQLDAVRFLIGDTDEAAKQFENEELLWLLTESDDDAHAAALAAVSRLIAKYARRVDKSVGDLRITYSQMYEHYLSVRDDLIDSTGGALAAPIAYAAGLTYSDRELRDGNSDRVPPIFEVGQDDYDRRRADDPRLGSY